jgi:HEAT repeats
MMLLVQNRFWHARALLRIFITVFALSLSGTSLVITHAQSPADLLVQQLRDLPTPLPNSNGVVKPEERRRSQLYDQLRRLGPEGVLALSRGLHDDDVQLRENAALALSVLAGAWFDSSWSKLDIKIALPALVVALQDSEPNVRAWSAQAIGEIGPDAESAVPELITLLSNPDEGSRNSACIALRGIGPPAKTALPVLRNSLSDPSKDVRRFAELAIKSIQP